MLIENTKIDGVKIINSAPFKDERGFFNRLFCQKELGVIRPDIEIKQINHSQTRQKGAIRGMHFQYPPHAEMKIVRCLKGDIFDVAIDLRKNSPTFLQWHGEILSSENMKALVIPEGFAHGFQALTDDVEIMYFVTNFYAKESEGAVRFDEPRVSVEWKLPSAVMSKKDLAVQFLNDNFEGLEV